MSEWIGARYKYPGTFRDAGVKIQPDIDFWMVMPSRMIISTTLIDPRHPVTFAVSFAEAMQPARGGVLPPPTSIRVPNDRLGKELRPIAGGIPVIVAPVPELDASFAETAEMTGGAAKPSYLGGGVPKETVAEFFVAAQSLFKTAPWGLVQEHQIVGVDIPRLKVKGACLSVIGGNDESFGILLFRSVEDYLAFGKRPAKGGPRKDRVAMRSMSFGSRKEIPPSMLREIKKHGWPVAGAHAYPTLFCVDRAMEPVPVAERDFWIMSACAFAFLLFFKEHGEIFNDTERANGIKASYINGEGLVVFFTAPY
ncbi:MAG: hypothetical protein QOI58_2026 [Thermoanaerobaculia bacterium]|jgi:hypothetical protein|nr:hypothetical protein [Thermoanaerobaculia bacterium]